MEGKDIQEPEKVETPEPGDRCYAPACHFWDGGHECTCQREKILHFSD